MENNKKRQLERRLLSFAVPVISSLFVQQLYGVIDMVIIGKYLGAEELAAVGNATNIVMLFIVISGGIELAVEIIISKYIGNQETKNLAEASVSILSFGFLIGMLVAVIGFLNTAGMFRVIQLPAELMAFAETYAKIYILGIPFIYLFDISRAMLISLGEANKSFQLMLASSILNLVLNLFFIAVLHLGVAGSALATVLAQAVCMLFSLKALHKKMKTNPHYTLRPSLKPRHLDEMASIALPVIFQQFVVTFSSVIVQALVNPFGNEVIIGFVAITKVMMISRIVIVGLAQTLTIFSAQLISGKRFEDLQTAYGFLVKTALIYALLTGAVFKMAPVALANIFFDADAHAGAFYFFRAYLDSYLFIQLLSVFKFMNESILRSALKMKEYLICNVGDLAVKLLSTYALIAPYSTAAFWIGELAARCFVLAASFYYMRQLKNGWREELAC